MSAPKTRSEESRLDSLWRAGLARGSSVGEILASRRSVILDDQDEAAASARASNSWTSVEPQTSDEGGSASLRPQGAECRDAAPLPLDSPAEFSPLPHGVDLDTLRLRNALPSTPALDRGRAALEEEPLVSPVTDSAIASAFVALSADVAIQSSGMIETLVRQMLRPMLRRWLNDNFPNLVESLVRDEIQRLARSDRRGGGSVIR